MPNTDLLRRAPAVLAALGLAVACQAPSPIPGPGPELDHDASFVVTGSHAGLQCIDCHDRGASSFQTARVDCVHCHGEATVSPRHAAVTGYAWVSAACIGCHRGGTVAFDHTSFPTALGSQHGGISCTECHGPTQQVADLKCATCHGGPGALAGAHAGLAGYAPGPAACYGCHRDGAVPAFDHSFPIAAGTRHAPPITCADCHGATRAVADLKCTACHGAQSAVDAKHAGLVGYAYSSAACFECHRDGRVPALDHTAFPITAGTTHAGLACADCHGATRAKADLSCTGCHAGKHAKPAMDAAHAGVASYAWASPACYDCHPRSDVRLPAGHDTNQFPVTGSAAHGTLTCGQCHGTTRAIADLRCTACHGQVEAGSQHARIPASRKGSRDGVTRLSYQWSAPFCVKCHADGQVNTIASHPRISHGLTGSGHAPFCLTCHPAVRTAGKTWAADWKQSTCLSCHTSNNPN